MRVLLTSFEPFGTHTLNSSLEVGRAVVQQPLPGLDLDWLVLPVTAGKCVEQAQVRIESARPDLVLALGQMAGARTLHVEQVALNWNDFSIPDNAGNLLVKQRIVADGPCIQRATIPVGELVQNLRTRGVPIETSWSAGNFVCNHLFYSLLHRAAVISSPHQIGFVHLPVLAEQVPANQKWPSLSLAQMVEAVRRVLTALAEFPSPARRLA
jgi:pyroglutamyl-peptidase